MTQLFTSQRGELVRQILQAVKTADYDKAYKLSETYAEIVEKVIPSALEEINTRKFLFGDELFISAGRSIKSEIVPGSAKKPEPCIKVHSENVKKAPEPHFGRLKVLVGKIVDIKKHPEADSLFVETVDVGEVQPRTICSGLVGKVPIEDLDQKLALFCCNLKAVRMRGVLSQGMILAASDGSSVEILTPPQGAKVGDRVECSQYLGECEHVLNPKHKVWETVQKDLKVNEKGIAEYKGNPLIVAGIGNVTATTLRNCKIS